MMSDLSGKPLLQTLAFQMGTLGRHAVSTVCLRTPIAGARYEAPVNRMNLAMRIESLTDESGDQERVRIDMA